MQLVLVGFLFWLISLPYVLPASSNCLQKSFGHKVQHPTQKDAYFLCLGNLGELEQKCAESFHFEESSQRCVKIRTKTIERLQATTNSTKCNCCQQQVVYVPFALPLIPLNSCSCTCPHIVTEAPTESPTESPTEAPTTAPTKGPTESPTEAPFHTTTPAPCRTTPTPCRTTPAPCRTTPAPYRTTLAPCRTTPAPCRTTTPSRCVCSTTTPSCNTPPPKSGCNEVASLSVNYQHSGLSNAAKCVSIPPDCTQYYDGTFVRDNAYCHIYYICINGQAITRTCSRGLYFDDKIMSCNYAPLVQCVNCGTTKKRNL